MVEVQATGDGGRNIVRQLCGRREIGHCNCGGSTPVAGEDTTPFDVEQPDVSQSCFVQWRNSLCGLRGVRVGEASNPGPPRDRGREVVSSDDEPLLALTPPPTQPVSGTLPTWVDSGRLHVDVPGRNVRPRLRVRSVPATIVDDAEGDASVPASSHALLDSVSPTILHALKEDLEASAVSTVQASSRALRRLRLVSGRARDEPTESMGPDASFM